MPTTSIDTGGDSASSFTGRRPPDDRRIAAEAPLPQAVADHHRARLHADILGCRQAAPEQGAHCHDVEE